MISKSVFTQCNEKQQFIYYVGDDNTIHKVYPVFIKPIGLMKYKKKMSEVQFLADVVFKDVVIAVRLQQLFVTLRAAEHSVRIKENNAKMWLGKPDSV